MAAEVARGVEAPRGQEPPELLAWREARLVLLVAMPDQAIKTSECLEARRDSLAECQAFLVRVAVLEEAEWVGQGLLELAVVQELALVAESQAVASQAGAPGSGADSSARVPLVAVLDSAARKADSAEGNPGPT